MASTRKKKRADDWADVVARRIHTDAETGNPALSPAEVRARWAQWIREADCADRNGERVAAMKGKL